MLVDIISFLRKVENKFKSVSSLAMKTTNFGYQQVSLSEKTEKVTGVFRSVAKKYDLMNDLMSFGMHRLWKYFAIYVANVTVNDKVLDLAGGTGDLTIQFAKKTQHIVLSDINDAMLQEARNRLFDAGITHVQIVQANAECLSFPDNYFDVVTIAFGLRNVTTKENALKSIQRVLKPGGRCLILEFSKPVGQLVNKMYDAYSFSVLPKLGKIIAKDEDSYRYLAESIRMHPDQNTLLSMMQAAGFDNCSYHNLAQGIVALHRGYKF